MKLTFESNLNYQQEAIKSITDLFEGQPLDDVVFTSEISELDTFNHIYSYGNKLIISEEQILSNLQEHSSQ
jgi:type III restriction enzyme